MTNHAKLLTMIPYANFIGMSYVSHLGESMCLLPAQKELLGQQILPALHGGMLSGFIEATASCFLMYHEQLTEIPRILNTSIQYLPRTIHRDIYGKVSFFQRHEKMLRAHVEVFDRDKMHSVAHADVHFLMP